MWTQQDLIWLLFIWIAGAFFATMIGYNKGRTLLGVVLGIVFGPLGAIQMAVVQSNNKTNCRYCQKSIMKAATRCPHCTSELA